MHSTVGAHFDPVGGKLRFVETPSPMDQSKFKLKANVPDVLFAREIIDAEALTFALLWKSLGTLRIRTAVRALMSISSGECPPVQYKGNNAWLCGICIWDYHRSDGISSCSFAAFFRGLVKHGCLPMTPNAGKKA